MIRAELFGRHRHETRNGVGVHIWQRDGRFVARGYYQRKRFGVTLGMRDCEAEAKLRKLLVDIEEGRFNRPSESRYQHYPVGPIPQLIARDLVNRFLADKRRTVGENSTNDYSSRLAHVLRFAEQPGNAACWPTVIRIDREFVLQLKAHLAQSQTSRNGKPGGRVKPLRRRHIINILETFRGMLLWARRLDVHCLPADWPIPLTSDMIGRPDQKDPLRANPISLDIKRSLIARMDLWQLCHLTWSLILPLRPEEAAGLLVTDIDWERKRLGIGNRLGGDDHTKESVSYVLPYPDCLEPLLRVCEGNRSAGPLLRSRKAFVKLSLGRRVHTPRELEERYHIALRQSAGSVLSTADRKRVFRRLLRKLGGVSGDSLAKEYKRLAAKFGLEQSTFLYELRHSNTQAMHDAGLSQLELRYLTGHKLTDILHTYTGLDPAKAMNRYYATIEPLLESILERERELGIVMPQQQGLAGGVDAVIQ
jgi:integrase